MMAEDNRLERIEKKLDTLSDAVVSLARMEERMITLFKRMDNYDENQREIGKRVHVVEKAVNTNGLSLRFGGSVASTAPQPLLLLVWASV